MRSDHKYIQIAEGIEKLIQNDILKIGDKLPSVRTVSQEHGVSLGTAFQAYYHIEAKGLIESRPKSGYYVRFNNKKFPALPKPLILKQAVNEISIQEMIHSVFVNISEKDLINLSLGSPAIELLPAAKLNKSILYAVRNSPHHCLDYEDVQGNAELRKQIAKLSFNWGGRIDAEDIIVTTGCTEALVICLKSVTQPGDTVAIESPAYFGLFQILENLGLKSIEIPAHPSEGIQIDYLEKVLKSRSVKACLFVPNFSNPLGSCIPDEKKKELVKLITDYRIPLIEDDIYGELFFGKHRPKTCKTYDKEGWVLHCSSFSKSLAPGYRIGWCIPGRFSEKVKQLKIMNSISATTLTQVALAHFLSIGRYEYHLKNLRKALHTQCLRYIQSIIEYFPANVKINRPTGGFSLWIELGKDVNGFKLWQEAKKNRISFTPGQIFSIQGNYRNYIRISFGKPFDRQLEESFKTLGNLIKRLEK